MYISIYLFFIKEPVAKNNSFVMRSLEWCLISTLSANLHVSSRNSEHESGGNRHCSDAVRERKMCWASSVTVFHATVNKQIRQDT